MNDRPLPRGNEAGQPARPPFRLASSPAGSAGEPAPGLPARPGPLTRPGVTPGAISRPSSTVTPSVRTPGTTGAVGAPPPSRLIGAQAGPAGSAQPGDRPVRVLVVD